MRVVIGIDGGGTKTRFAAYNLIEKRMMATCVLGGTDYKQDGYDLVIERIQNGISTLLEACGSPELAAIGFGMPGYSENPIGDHEMEVRLKRCFGQIPIFLFNDVYVAFEGAHYGKSGILVVAGTGSLAYGRDDEGTIERCGGWSEFFGDEGSGYWIGKKLLESFSKQSDGRRGKTQLYQLVKNYFGLLPEESDFEILLRKECNSGNRAATASLNYIVKQAADMGDTQALEILNQSAKEISELICALIRKLHFQGNIAVAFSGGLFNMEQYITKPVDNILKKNYNLTLIKPYLGPCCGAVILAIEKAEGKKSAASFYQIMSRDEMCKGL